VPTLVSPDVLVARREPLERGSPTEYIGKGALLHHVHAVCDALPISNKSKPPFAVIGSTRSGKTRLLLELTNRLRERDVAAIYISFSACDDTPFFAGSSELDAHDALLRRVSFALSAEGGPQWSDCRAAPVPAAELARQLDACTRPIVLVVNSINSVWKPWGETQIKGTKDLWLWLNEHFLRSGRGLVFGSHYNDTYEQVTRNFAAMCTDKFRPAKVLSLPLVEHPWTEAALFPPDLGVTPETIALMGRVPGHLLDRRSYDTKLMSISSRFDLKAFARTCLQSQQGIDRLPRDLRAAGQFEADSRYWWTPYCIAYLIGRSAPLQILRDLCEAMVVAKSGTGRLWEVTVALAICLHRLAGVPHGYLSRVGDGSQVDCVVRCPPSVASWAELESWVTTNAPGHALVLPSAAALPGANLIECVGGKPVGEYQLKLRDGAPSYACPAHLPGTAWLMVGDPPSSTRGRADGWIECGRDEMASFLGDSLHRAMPHLWHSVGPERIATADHYAR
jgi:hypothetical protein